ncbi:hypothetical protein B9W61_34255 [Streptomyces sp. CS057]|nr:hypothetical protein B9W61_34255 [Streptomyces sp. CS057]
MFPTAMIWPSSSRTCWVSRFTVRSAMSMRSSSSSTRPSVSSVVVSKPETSSRRERSSWSRSSV